jgi:hypothetical protein
LVAPENDQSDRIHVRPDPTANQQDKKWLHLRYRPRVDALHKRLLRLEAEAEEPTVVLSEERIRLLERHSPDFRMCDVETSAPVELLNQDTFYSAQLKGVGKLYVQVVIDAFCSLAFAKVYTSKMPITAADLIYDRVLPFYDALGATTRAVLTDNGREFCVKPWGGPYEPIFRPARHQAPDH